MRTLAVRGTKPPPRSTPLHRHPDASWPGRADFRKDGECNDSFVVSFRFQAAPALAADPGGRGRRLRLRSVRHLRCLERGRHYVQDKGEGDPRRELHRQGRMQEWPHLLQEGGRRKPLQVRTLRRGDLRRGDLKMVRKYRPKQRQRIILSLLHIRQKHTFVPDVKLFYITIGIIVYKNRYP